MLPPAGRIIHGGEYAQITIPLAQPIREVRLALAKIAALRARTAPPQPVLNKHCADCEFRSRCRADAIERDDLSLLTGLNPKALKTWNGKGVSTVTQLSDKSICAPAECDRTEQHTKGNKRILGPAEYQRDMQMQGSRFPQLSAVRRV
jgi:predicted RecB family nuclease